VERETKKRIQTRLTSHVSRFTLHNPHGSDVTYMSIEYGDANFKLSNPHGSDVKRLFTYFDMQALNKR